jgi:hypothetical protein
MANKSTAGFDQQNPTAEPKLEHAYAHIGISAVVAALRFGPGLSPNNRSWPQNDERVTRRCLRLLADKEKAAL